MINDNRMQLYRRGLNDKEIAEHVGVSKRAIWYWRKQHNLLSNSRINKKSVRSGYVPELSRSGKPMEDILTSRQCEIMRGLFSLLLTASNRNPKNVDVSRIIKFYNEKCRENEELFL